MQAALPGVVVNGAGAERLWNTSEPGPAGARLPSALGGEARQGGVCRLDRLGVRERCGKAFAGAARDGPVAGRGGPGDPGQRSDRSRPRRSGRPCGGAGANSRRVDGRGRPGGLLVRVSAAGSGPAAQQEPLLPPELQARVARACTTAVAGLEAERRSAGHWTGGLSASALSTATAVVALTLVARRDADAIGGPPARWPLDFAGW